MGLNEKQSPRISRYYLFKHMFACPFWSFVYIYAMYFTYSHDILGLFVYSMFQPCAECLQNEKYACVYFCAD